MTRKDYIEVAEEMRQLRPEPQQASYVLWCRTLDALSSVFARDNDRFQKARFVRACGATGMDEYGRAK